MADNKSTYSSLMNELVDVINEKANSSDSKNLEELVATAKTIVKPEGTLEIIENGEYDVTNYAVANVNIESGSGSSETDMLQQLVNNQGTCNYLFYKYTGTNLDFITNLDISNIKEASYMYGECVNLNKIPNMDYNNLEKVDYMFYKCSALTTLILNFNSVVNAQSMLNSCSNLTELEIHIDNAEILTSVFYGCVNLTKIIGLNTSKGKNFNYAFSNCSNLIEIPTIDLNSVAYNQTNNNVTYMFNNCKSLKEINIINMNRIRDLSSMFNSCTSLTKITGLNTSGSAQLQSLFYGCEALETINVDVSSATSLGSTFYNCKNLTNVTITNIKVNLTIGSGSTYGHLLTLESLLNTCQECINVSASRKLTVGSENITKLSTVYVKLTNEPEVNSALPKLPMIQCESTDEGAMLVADYMALKQWSLA